MKPQRGDLLELEVSKVVHGGYGLTRHDGFVLFVEGALPGEVVAARVTEAKKSHGNAELLEVLSASDSRVSHMWPEADVSREPGQRAGGADYGHINLDYQRELKTEILRDSLERFGRLDPSLSIRCQVVAIPGEESGQHWRTRIALNVDDRGQAGPYAEGTHRVIPVESLPLATQAINELGAHQMEWSGHQKIRIIDNSRDAPRLVIDSQKPEPITQWVGDIPFRLADQSFWQVHHSAAKTLFDDVSRRIASLSLTTDLEHWDLYGGVGLFGRAIVEALGPAVKVTSVEYDSVSTEYAAANFSEVVGARALSLSTEKFVAEAASQNHESSLPVGVVVLDPPRSGAGKTVIDALARIRPQAVIYVACDPVALGRDMGTFREHGYQPSDIVAFDLFPHTHHFETVVTFTPEGASA